jgi:hypothetical protein
VQFENNIYEFVTHQINNYIEKNENEKHVYLIAKVILESIAKELQVQYLAITHFQQEIEKKEAKK